jgi:hypothetical protein
MDAGMKYPKVRSVRTEGDKTLWVKFDNGVAKLYDCKPLLSTQPFSVLEDDVMFRQAHADSNGYGVTWNDDIDLAESEIWINGKETEQGSVPDANTRR